MRWKILIEPRARLDIARKFVGLGDNRFERRRNKSVAAVLRPGQRARIAAQQWKMRRNFPGKRHIGIPCFAAARLCAVRRCLSCMLFSHPGWFWKTPHREKSSGRPEQTGFPYVSAPETSLRPDSGPEGRAGGEGRYGSEGRNGNAGDQQGSSQRGKAREAPSTSTATHKALITRNLRLVYGEVAGEPVPSRITELLNQLGAAKETRS